jgi:hypothetical protein
MDTENPTTQESMPLTEIRIPFLNSISSRFQIFAGPKNPLAGNGHHYYEIHGDGKLIQSIHFQEGAMLTGTEINGVLSICLTTILVHHFKAFQSGDFPSRETAIMITHLEDVQNWQARRADDREARGVLGHHAK